MANVATDSLVQMTATGYCFRQRIRHVRVFKVTTVSTLLIPERDFQEAMLTQTKPGGIHDLFTRYLNCLANDYTLSDIKCQIIQATRTAYSNFSYAAGPHGTGGVCFTANLQSAFTASGEFTGRHYRGVYKIGPLPNISTEDGYITPAHQAVLQTYANSFTVSLPVTVGADLVTLDPVLYQAPPKGAPVPYGSKKIFTVRVSDETRVKSTRTVGRGE